MKVLVDTDVLFYHANPMNPEADLRGLTLKFNELIHQIEMDTFSKDLLFCYSKDGDNFRKREYETYKLNRAGTDKPHLFYKLKEWVVQNLEPMADSCNGEADDRILIEAARCLKKGEPYIVASVDKDLRTMPGLFLDLRTREIAEVSELDAMEFMFEQFLTGDPTDGIAGLYKVGKVRARKMLAEYTTWEDMWQGVKDIWLEQRGNEAIDEYNRDMNLVYIRRRKKDVKTLDFWDMSWEQFERTLGFKLTTEGPSWT